MTRSKVLFDILSLLMDERVDDDIDRLSSLVLLRASY